MSETVYSDIRAALTQRLQAMPGLLDVAWENMTFTPQVDTPYLAPTVLWGEGSQAELGETGRNWQLGIYQIACIYPTNVGVGPINAMAGKIADWFKRGTLLTYNGLTVTIRKVYLGPTLSSDGGVQQPVSISFYCQTAN